MQKPDPAVVVKAEGDSVEGDSVVMELRNPDTLKYEVKVLWTAKQARMVADALHECAYKIEKQRTANG